MEDGPPSFPQGFTCPVVLGSPTGSRTTLSPTGLSPCIARFSNTGSANVSICNSLTCSQRSRRIPQPRVRKTPCAATPHAVWAHPRSLAATRGVAILLSVPSGTEMVHFPEFASVTYEFSNEWLVIDSPGCPIRKSPDRSLLTAPRGLSQSATSFIASLRQGIHRAPLVT